ncbi:cuticle protein CB5 [Penaeus vannamei]|uniref:Cuticle protein CB5 n=1 Tax=Penaeus vannamei TaxID=6689 RepID=A0A3R7QK62_PENVA|nr:cuticle protein CB5 [Penaeus vannamei]
MKVMPLHTSRQNPPLLPSSHTPSIIFTLSSSTFNIFSPLPPQLLVLLGLAALAAARPDEILDFEGDDAEHDQEGEPGKAVTGEYKWESPEGIEFVVKYIADDKGFRVLESNAVPSAGGVRADGEQADLDGDSEEDDK